MRNPNLHVGDRVSHPPSFSSSSLSFFPSPPIHSFFLFCYLSFFCFFFFCFLLTSPAPPFSLTFFGLLSYPLFFPFLLPFFLLFLFLLFPSHFTCSTFFSHVFWPPLLPTLPLAFFLFFVFLFGSFLPLKHGEGIMLCGDHMSPTIFFLILFFDFFFVIFF